MIITVRSLLHLIRSSSLWSPWSARWWWTWRAPPGSSCTCEMQCIAFSQCLLSHGPLVYYFLYIESSMVKCTILMTVQQRVEIFSEKSYPPKKKVFFCWVNGWWQMVVLWYCICAVQWKRHCFSGIQLLGADGCTCVVQYNGMGNDPFVDFLAGCWLLALGIHATPPTLLFASGYLASIVHYTPKHATRNFVGARNLL